MSVPLPMIGLNSVCLQFGVVDLDTLIIAIHWAIALCNFVSLKGWLTYSADNWSPFGLQLNVISHQILLLSEAIYWQKETSACTFKLLGFKLGSIFTFVHQPATNHGHMKPVSHSPFVSLGVLFITRCCDAVVLFSVNNQRHHSEGSPLQQYCAISL